MVYRCWSKFWYNISTETVCKFNSGWKIVCVGILIFFVTNPQILLLRWKWQTKCMVMICVGVNVFVCYENDSLINFKALVLSLYMCKRGVCVCMCVEGGGGGVVLLIAWYNFYNSFHRTLMELFYVGIICKLCTSRKTAKERPNRKLNAKLLNVLFLKNLTIFYFSVSESI